VSVEGIPSSPSHSKAVPQERGRQEGWDRLTGWLADIHWGVLVLTLLGILIWWGKATAEDVRAFATAAGLLGVGHGIHTAAKHLAKKR
jgi:hypothetical protein